MTLNFKYRSVNRPNGKPVRAPSIPILLSGRENVETLGLLDSGADVSAMPLALAEILGLDLSGERSACYGIGGTVDSVETQVPVIVEKGHERHAFMMPVKVIYGDYDFPMLLGRTGFFDEFVIAFNQHHERLQLKRIATS